jgi:molybdate transport system substrate-binding protein
VSRLGVRGWILALVLALAAVAAVVAVAWPGDEASGPPAAQGADRPRVLAAASLTETFTALAGAEFSFGGSDQLAFQITEGAPADVFASASPKYTQQLFADGLVVRPRRFATNSLVVIVPRANHAGIDDVGDLARPGVKLVIGDADVPVGAYARIALGALGLNAALTNVVSEEPDVKGVMAKVALDEADAGLVYATDVGPVRTRVRVIPVDVGAQPAVVYEIAVVRDTGRRSAAEAFVRRVLGPEGRRALRAQGFGLP